MEKVKEIVALLWVRKWKCGVCGENVYYFSSCSVIECGCGCVYGHISAELLKETFICLGDEPLKRTMRGVEVET